MPVDLTTAPVRDGEQLVGAVMTFTDRRSYDALAARHAQLLAVLDVSLRGPLAELRGELGGLAADPAGQLWPEANQVLHYLAAGYARMTTLVDNVLSYQRLAAGKERLARETVSLDAVVAAGVEGAIELIGPGRARFAVHAPPIEAEVDPVRLAQALAHLIADVAGLDATGNAMAVGGTAAQDPGAHGAPGGAPQPAAAPGDSTIMVGAAQRGDVVRIEVRGPHPGGDPVHEPIVRGIVRKHGGVLQTHKMAGMSGSAYVLEVPVSADGKPLTSGRADTDDSTGAVRVPVDQDNSTTVMPVPKEPRAVRTARGPRASWGAVTPLAAGRRPGVGRVVRAPRARRRARQRRPAARRVPKRPGAVTATAVVPTPMRARGSGPRGAGVRAATPPRSGPLARAATPARAASQSVLAFRWGRARPGWRPRTRPAAVSGAGRTGTRAATAVRGRRRASPGRRAPSRSRSAPRTGRAPATPGRCPRRACRPTRDTAPAPRAGAGPAGQPGSAGRWRGRAARRARRPARTGGPDGTARPGAVGPGRRDKPGGAPGPTGTDSRAVGGRCRSGWRVGAAARRERRAGRAAGAGRPGAGRAGARPAPRRHVRSRGRARPGRTRAPGAGPPRPAAGPEQQPTAQQQAHEVAAGRVPVALPPAAARPAPQRRTFRARPTAPARRARRGRPAFRSRAPRPRLRGAGRTTRDSRPSRDPASQGPASRARGSGARRPLADEQPRPGTDGRAGHPGHAGQPGQPGQPDVRSQGGRPGEQPPAGRRPLGDPSGAGQAAAGGDAARSTASPSTATRTGATNTVATPRTTRRAARSACARSVRACPSRRPSPTRRPRPSSRTTPRGAASPARGGPAAAGPAARVRGGRFGPAPQAGGAPRRGVPGGPARARGGPRRRGPGPGRRPDGDRAAGRLGAAGPGAAAAPRAAADAAGPATPGPAAPTAAAGLRRRAGVRHRRPGRGRRGPRAVGQPAALFVDPLTGPSRARRSSRCVRRRSRPRSRCW